MAYMMAVLTDLLHSQRDPLALCLLLQAYDQLDDTPPPCCPLLTRFRHYYSLWIPESGRTAKVSPWGVVCLSVYYSV